MSRKRIQVEILEQKPTNHLSPELSESLRRQRREAITSKTNSVLFTRGNTYDLLGIKDIDADGVILTTKGEYIKFVEIHPVGLSKMTNRDKNRLVSQYRNFISTLPSSIQIKIISDRTDTAAITQPLIERYEEEKNPLLKYFREDQLRMIDSMARGEGVAKRYFLIIRYEGNINTGKRAKDRPTIVQDLNQQVNAISNALNYCGNYVIRHSNEKAFTIETLYRMLNPNTSVEETVLQRQRRVAEDFRQLQIASGDDGRRYMNDIATIAPLGRPAIQPHLDHVIMDGEYRSYYIVKNDAYPENILAGWLSNFVIYGCDVDLYFEKEESDTIINSLENEAAKSQATMIDQKRASDIRETGIGLTAAHHIIEALQNGESLFYGTIIITVKGRNYEELVDNRGKLERALKNDVTLQLARCDVMRYWKMTLPLLQIDSSIFKHFKHNFISTSLLGLYPFDEQILNEPEGIVLGLNATGHSVASIDFWSTRLTAPHFGIFGPTGSGKTFLTLMIASRMRQAGVKLLFILPVKGHEYYDAVKWYGGEAIDFSGGSKTCINIFDIAVEKKLTDEELEDLDIDMSTQKSRLQQKIQDIKTFITLSMHWTTIDPEVESELDTTVLALYNSYGITNDDNSLYDSYGNPKECPTLRDYYESIQGNEILSKVSRVLRKYVDGSFSNLGGKTEGINMNSPCVAFDVSKNSEEDIPLFLFLALTQCYAKIKEDVTTRYLLVLDEGWKLLNSDISAKYVFELIKIVRGYAGAVSFATQNISDFDATGYAKPIVDNLISRFYLRVGEAEEEVFQTLFKLTKEQVDEISKQKTGVITMRANKENYTLLTSPTALEKDMYETNPKNKKAAVRRLRQYEKQAYNRYGNPSKDQRIS